MSDKQTRIRSLIRNGQIEVAALATTNEERTKEIIESIEARTDRKVASSVALSIDLLRLMLQLLTVINKTGAPKDMFDQLREHVMEIHTRTTTHLLLLSSDDNAVVEREVGCLTQLMEANINNLAQMERIAERISKDIRTIMQGEQP